MLKGEAVKVPFAALDQDFFWVLFGPGVFKDKVADTLKTLVYIAHHVVNLRLDLGELFRLTPSLLKNLLWHPSPEIFYLAKLRENFVTRLCFLRLHHKLSIFLFINY